MRVQLFHLKNLCKEIINVEFRPLCVKPITRDGVTIAAYEEETAGRILDSVIPKIQDIPTNKRAVYGAAYQARKSTLAYSLYICGIHSIDDFNNSELGRKDASGHRIMSIEQIYYYLLNKITEFSSSPKYNVLSEIAQHFYYSLGVTTGLTPNPDIKFNVNENILKPFREFNSKDMIESLGYYLKQEIELRDKRVNKELNNLLKALAVIDFFADLPSLGGSKPKVKPPRQKPHTDVKPSGPKPSHHRLINTNPNIKGGGDIIRRPKRRNFNSEADYNAANTAYKENYAARMSSYSIPDSVKRADIAKNKIQELDKIREVKTTDKHYGAFIVTSEVGNKGMY